MNRRSFLSTAGALSLAGCSQQTDDPARTDDGSEWPTNTTGSSPKQSGREWSGGHRDAESNGGLLHLDTVTVELVGANVAQQVGVTTTDPVEGNTESIPESEFTWYEASDNAFIWFVYVNFIQRDGEDPTLPPADHWRARPVLDENGPAVESFTTTFDPDPTYYRLPGYQGRDYTRPAYTTDPGRRGWSRILVFEVDSSAIELLHGDPPEVTWYYEAE